MTEICRTHRGISDLAEIGVAMADARPGKRMGREPGSATMPAAKVKATKVTAAVTTEVAAAMTTEVTAAVTTEVTAAVTTEVAAAVTTKMTATTMAAATSAKCHTRQHGREHNDGNSNA